MKYLSLDYGDSKTGIAISDALGIIARPFATVRTETAVEHITDIVAEEGVSCIVVGLAVNSDGELSASADKAKAFAEKLKKFLDRSIEFRFVNEAFSTKSAQQIMLQNYNKKQRRKKGLDDAIAAAVILQQFLDSQAGVL